MKKTIAITVLLITLSQSAYAAIKWVNGYRRKNGTYVSGHYKDGSNDEKPWNNLSNLQEIGIKKHTDDVGFREKGQTVCFFMCF